MDGVAPSASRVASSLMNGKVVYKMSGSGNDFVFVDGRLAPLASWDAESIRTVCDRRSGVGADGFAVLEPGSEPGRVRFHFFNNDGRRAPMCGNGALCATRMAAWLELAPGEGMVLETDSGVLESRCLAGPGQLAELCLNSVSRPCEPDIDRADGERSVHLATVGVPHVVVVVDNLAHAGLMDRGRELRWHPALGPDGANVNFISDRDGDWSMRTYERGVEGETLACGSGAVASAAVLVSDDHIRLPWEVRTASSRVLSVSGGPRESGGIDSPRLVGEGRLVFRAVLGE